MEMNQPVGQTTLDTISDGIVGKPMVRVDGRAKVTGGARYAYEFARGPSVGYGVLVEASIAKGRIAGMDTRTAEGAPGVLLVLTHRNAPAQGSSDHRNAWPVLSDDKVHYHGQPVALVVADSFEQARAAAALIKVDYTAESGAYVLQNAIKTARQPPSAQAPADSSVGDFEAAFRNAPVQIDVLYTTPHQSHAMMEPHATMAAWDGDKLTLHTANQMLNRSRKAVATTLKIPIENVRLVSPFIGGGFGAKLWAGADAMLAAIAARKLERPVKVALTRQQVFHVTTHRSDTVQRIRLGADNDGRLTAIGHDAFSGNRPNEDAFEGAANQTRTLYAGANRLTRHRLAALDVPTASSMRAPGEAVGLLALECAMDELAERVNLDPIELRLRNEPEQDPEKHVPYSSRNLVGCLREGARLFGWDKREARPGTRRDGQWLIGLGVAASTRSNPLQPSKASVRLDPDGTLTVRMAMTDLGTGTYTILTQIAAEMTGLPPNAVKIEIGDTAFPEASGSGGSFGAASSGSALYEACQALRGKLAAAAGMDAGAARFENASIVSDGTTKRLADLAGAHGLEADGEIKPGATLKKFSQQAYGAQFAEVGVDRDSGEVRLRRMLGVFTAGRILNPRTARSQAIGGMIFGVGAALTEELVMDPRYGFFVNHDLAEYHVPVHADAANVEAVFLPELDDKANPLKSKGIGELGICGAGAAVANAVYNACGVRVRDYPLTLDKILTSLPQQT